MTYDLSNPLHRMQFERRAESLLRRRSPLVELTECGRRTVSQNAYLHTLIRILALETGVSEQYAKDTYFKRMANGQLFVSHVDDPVDGERREALRSSSDLTAEEMSLALTRFRDWAAVNGFYLPEAEPKDDGTVAFASDGDREGFMRARVETDRASRLM